MPGMQRQRISGHSPYEPVFGFSRALVAGDRVLVAGTAPVPPGGGPPPVAPYDQARLCLDLIGEVLARAGTSLDHVIRTRLREYHAPRQAAQSARIRADTCREQHRWSIDVAHAASMDHPCYLN